MTGALPRKPELSRPVVLERLGDDELWEIEADARECAALAARFALLGVDRLRATIRLRRPKGGALIRGTGHLEAEVVQRCVVTLEPVHNRIDEDFTLFYTLKPEPEAPQHHDIVVEAEAEDPPEPLPPGGLDLGEAVAQQLGIALDPYPRAPGAALPAEASPEAERPAGPFAALESLKRGH